MESINIFSEKFHEIINEPLGLVLLESTKKEEKCVETKTRENPTSVDGNSCSYCQIQFSDLQIQREHYKLDWHRYNLKQSLLSKPPVTEEEFNEKTANDDVSSISGSDSDKEDTLDLAVAQGKLFLQNASKAVFSIYKCIVFDRKEDISDDLLNPRLTKCTLQNPQWTLLMLGGGHFAGAVFKGNEPFLHKTFHCYTVRAGQGTGQTTKDNRGQGGKGGPKSAGASLRRYNEQGMQQHVKDIVENWKDEIEKSSLIIYRAAGPFNRSILFGGSNPLLDRTSKKLRTIPFSTRRATFTEVKRVHALLSSAELYESLETATRKYALQKTPDADFKRNKTRTSCVNRAKSRELIERPLPATLSSSGSSEEELDEEIGDLRIESGDTETQDGHPQQPEDLTFEAVDENICCLEDLQEFGDSLTPEQRKKPTKKKSKPKKSKSKKLKEQEEAKRKELVDVISRGDISAMERLLANHLNSLQEGVGKEEARTSFVNQVLDENLNTLLHEAALNEQKEMLRFLLDNSADPCLKNKTQHTAYTYTQSKEIREYLKQFAKQNPEKFNYNKAQIPVNALTEEELAEKRKAQRKVKKEKDKEKRKENEIKRKEEEERQRFLNLSDREKRALAAEKRLRDLSGKVITRCFNCAADITGKVPFEYMGNVFCTIDCLKAHRLKGPIVLS